MLKAVNKVRSDPAIHTIQQRQTILMQMPPQDIWGIGRRIAKRLPLLAVNNAFELAQMKPHFARAHFNTEMANTVQELNGKAVKTWDQVRADKQQIFSTRSFGKRVTDAQSLNQALVQHGAIAAKKAREQGSLCHTMMAFAASSPFDDKPKSFKYFHHFHVATSDTTVIANTLTENLNKLFQQGVPYYRVGVGLLELANQQHQQLDMFDTNKNNPALMQCIDTINARFGQGVTVAGEGISKPWSMKRNFLSPQYTTRWQHIPKIRC
ncbi:DUF4113 domain-containing protein [Motilimonas cestriensis]|uniref:DUF4113 domain-containing protein n=1 Tax=Motilimonas cestriensis TaxID=2742685 RepID=A0ABS8WBM8_9GAMM|nr:DUF4113 domain-containing protein [Motilimonas cestriensis]MCE2594800.1 DUF4113 domain-containing protein [Motilimonas cestriensis]